MAHKMCKTYHFCIGIEIEKEISQTIKVKLKN